MGKTFIYICLCLTASILAQAGRQVNHQDNGKLMKDALILDGWKEVRFDQDATIALVDSDTTPVRSANLQKLHLWMTK
jgi:hypothetical protein